MGKEDDPETGFRMADFQVRTVSFRDYYLPSLKSKHDSGKIPMKTIGHTSSNGGFFHCHASFSHVSYHFC